VTVERIHLSPELMMKCWVTANARYSIKYANTNRQVSNRPGRELHFEGLRAEAALGEYVGQPELVDYSVTLHGDGGTDMVFDGRRIQIKASTYKPPLLRFDIEGRHRFNEAIDIAVLAHVPRSPDDEPDEAWFLQSGWVDLIGWIDRWEFFQRATVRNFGHGDRLVVEPPLNPISSLLKPETMETNAMISKTDLWDRLGKTDPAHTSPFQRAGGFKGTAIKPMASFRRMTEEFGACGVGWGINAPAFDTITAGDELLVFCIVSIWHGSVDRVVFGVGGDKVMGKFKSGSYTDDEAFKKAYTDAITNALKLIGVGADVHMGMFDDSKYVNQLRAEFQAEAQSETQEEIDSRNKYIARCKTAIASFQDGERDAILAWWYKNEQARQDFNLSNPEVNELKGLAGAKANLPKKVSA
jgi:hypothetical protein